jgi:hypothetical protein
VSGEVSLRDSPEACWLCWPLTAERSAAVGDWLLVGAFDELEADGAAADAPVCVPFACRFLMAEPKGMIHPC